MDFQAFGEDLILHFGYFGLFVSGIISSTMFPFPIEVLMLFGIYLGMDLNLAIIVTSFGSAVGATTGYYIGLKGLRSIAGKWVDAQEERRAIRIFKKYGPISLVLSSWIPFFGDAIPIVAGTFHIKFWDYFIPLMVGKFSKFISVAYAFHFFGIF
jgi:membrane protein YqaA with SNARE-associated domain